MSCPGTATWIALVVPGGQWILKSAAARETGKKGTRWRTISGGGWIIAASSWWSGIDSHKVFGLKQKSSPERLLFYWRVRELSQSLRIDTLSACRPLSAST